MIYQLDTVHPKIRQSAACLQEWLPGLSFKLGELVQDRVVLDPYLIAEYRDEWAVLGIWDGQRIIAPRPKRLNNCDPGVTVEQYRGREGAGIRNH